MSFYKIVDTEGEGIKLLGDLPSEGNTGDFLVWNYDYSKPTCWLAAKGINFQSWSSSTENLVNFQTKTKQGKNYNLLTSYEGIDPANSLTNYRIENYNKFRTLHNNDLAIVEVNTRLANGTMGGGFPNNANILIEYRKANSDGTIAEDNYLKLQQDSLHTNPIETNNFSIGFEGDLKVNKNAEAGVTKVAVWDENGTLTKSTFDPGTGTGGDTLPDAQEHRMLHGSKQYNQFTPSTWTLSNNMTYEEYADDAMDTLWTLSNSDMANTNESFNYSTIREHLTNYGLKSYFDMETIKGNTDSRAVLASSTEISNNDDSASSGATYSIYDDQGESHLHIGVDSKRDYDISADNWRILHDGGLKVDDYAGANENDIGDAYWDAQGVLRRRATTTGSGIIHGQHRFQIYTDNTNELVIFRSDFRYIPNIRDNFNPLYDILKNINIYLIRNGGEFHHIPRHTILSDRIHIFFGDTPGMNGEELDIRFSYDPVFTPPTGGPQA